VDTERAGQANSVLERYINDLPIDRRDYLEFTLLVPGVSNSNTITDNADFRAKQTPQSGLSFYGSNGRGNSVTVDGGEPHDDAGGVPLNVSQEVVKEFRINRSNYAAELGSASGASINIVTKSGTNHLHGGLYGFFRNDVMDARDPLAFSPALALDPTFSNFSLTATGAPVKNTLSRQQFGGTISLPIRHDRTFIMAAYEGLHSDAARLGSFAHQQLHLWSDRGATIDLERPHSRRRCSRSLSHRTGGHASCDVRWGPRKSPHYKSK
jgi:hypothetical protein